MARGQHDRAAARARREAGQGADITDGDVSVSADACVGEADGFPLVASLAAVAERAAVSGNPDAARALHGLLVRIDEVRHLLPAAADAAGVMGDDDLAGALRELLEAL